MAHSIKDYVSEFTGKGIDWDGRYGNQCMDLYRHYVKWLGIPKQSMPVTGAADVWDTYLTEYFDRIVNTPELVPEPGDIVIWKRAAGLPFGHIAVFVSGDVNQFTSFDQNWPVEGFTNRAGDFIGTGTPHLQKHSYNNVLGVLRPKKEVIVMPPDNNEYGDTVYKSTQYDEVVKGIYGADKDPRQTPSGELLATVNGFKSQATTLRNENAELKAEVENRTEQVSRIREESARNEALYKDATIALKRANDDLAVLRASYESRLEEAQQSINSLAKEKGALAIELAKVKAELADVKKGILPDWNLLEWLLFPLTFIFKKRG